LPSRHGLSFIVSGVLMAMTLIPSRHSLSLIIPRALMAMIPIPSHHNLSFVVSVALTGTLISFAAAPASSDWQIAPEIRVSGGDESDVAVSPELAGIVIPGGPFIELAPAVSARGWIGRRTLLDLGTFATVQRFLNDESRLVYAHTAYAGAFQDLGSSLRGRLSMTLGYLDDSELETARRLGVGAELGMALVQPQWNAEVWGGGGSRTYPNLVVQERLNRTTTYDERAWSAGTILRFSPGRNFGLRADGIRQITDSPDPFFDSNSWVVSGGMDVGLMAPLFLTAYGAYQEREFDNRPQGENRDEYWQIGLGMRYALGPGWSASIRWGYSEYTWPDGTGENSYRLVAGIERAWGRRAVLPLPRVDVGALTRASGGSIREPDSDGRVCFRILAVDAKQVSVAGSFNAWDPEATPLRPAGDGWWESCIKLAPGVYQYAYVINGAWTAPPEAKTTVEDGFGGRNGILEVLPPDM